MHVEMALAAWKADTVKTGEVELRMQLVSKFERDLSISLSIPFFDVFCSKSAVTTW